MVVLSKRLAAVAELVPQGARLLDVGSDHAYLPLFLLEDKRINFAVAGEVVQGPYQIALTNVKAAGRTSQVSVRLANGLSALLPEDHLDTVVIAGMGGGLIADILAEGQKELSDIRRLVLQPNNREDELRTWLNRSGFQILAEDIVEDCGKFYEIIAAEKGQQTLSTQEICFGPQLIKVQSSVFIKRWSLEIKKLEKIRDRIPAEKTTERSAISQKIYDIKEVLNVS